MCEFAHSGSGFLLQFLLLLLLLWLWLWLLLIVVVVVVVAVVLCCGMEHKILCRSSVE